MRRKMNRSQIERLGQLKLPEFMDWESAPYQATLSELVKPKTKAFCVVDTETTGLNPLKDRVWEIGAARYNEEGVLEKTFHAIIDPGIPIPPEVENLCGVNSDYVRQNGRPTIEVLREFGDFLGGLDLVAYGAAFDAGFLQAEMKRHIPSRLIFHRYICALSAARWFVPGLKSYDLSTVANHFGVKLDKAHRADADAAATGEVVLRLMETAKRPGSGQVAEAAFGQLYNHIFDWRNDVAERRLQVPGYYLLSAKEITNIASTRAMQWQRNDGALISMISETLKVKAAPSLEPDSKNPDAFIVEMNGRPPASVTISPPKCSIDGEPNPWPCDHIIAAVRRNVLESSYMFRLPLDFLYCINCGRTDHRKLRGLPNAHCSSCGKLLECRPF